MCAVAIGNEYEVHAALWPVACIVFAIPYSLATEGLGAVYKLAIYVGDTYICIGNKAADGYGAAVTTWHRVWISNNVGVCSAAFRRSTAVTYKPLIGANINITSYRINSNCLDDIGWKRTIFFCKTQDNFVGIGTDKPYAVIGAHPFTITAIYGNCFYLLVGKEITGKLIILYNTQLGLALALVITIGFSLVAVFVMLGVIDK